MDRYRWIVPILYVSEINIIHSFDGLERKHERQDMWFGHVRRKDHHGYIRRRMLSMVRRGRPKRRFMYAVREDMAVVEVTEAYAEDRSKMKMKNLLC